MYCPAPTRSTLARDGACRIRPGPRELGGRRLAFGAADERAGSAISVITVPASDRVHRNSLLAEFGRGHLGPAGLRGRIVRLAEFAALLIDVMLTIRPNPRATAAGASARD